MFFRALLLCLVLVSPIYAQITVPDVVPPYDPIVAGCNCIVPKGATVQFLWRVDENSKYLVVEDGVKLHIWAPPGAHWIEAIVIVQTFKDMTVLVPDPAFPEDPSKFKVQKIKIQETFDVQRYNKAYAVGTAPIPPGPTPPGPTPPGPTPPGPSPTEPFAKEVQKWIKAIPAASYNKDKMLGIANNYSTTASEAVATQGWNLAAFTAKTKEKNLQTLTVDEVGAWTNPFFKPMAEYHAKLFQERKLTTTDVAGLAKLWRDTADAITVAVAAGAVNAEL